MHSSSRPTHHTPSGRRFFPRSPPSFSWDDYYVGNPSSIYVDPDGEVVTSSDPVSPNVPAGDTEASGVPPAVDAAPSLASSSLMPTDVSKAVQTSSVIQISAAGVTSSATDSSSASTQSSVASSATTATTTSDAVTTDSATATSSTSATSPASETTSLVSASSLSSAAASSSTSDDPSAAASPTSRVNSASSSSDLADHRTSFYIGIAFATIAGVGLVIAVFAWWLRIRSRTRRRKLSKTTAWPWEHDRLGGRQMSLEGGLGIHGYHGDMAQHSTLTSPSLIGGEGGRPVDFSHAFPLPPPQAHTEPGNSPYVTIPLHGARQSVPDLAPDLGTLQITNLMPGDLSSGGESSRASTALGMLHTYPAEYGTPFMPHRPCFLGVDNGGLEVPWGPLRVRRTGTLTAQQPPPRESEATTMSMEKQDGLLPYPGDIGVSADFRPPASDNRQGSWAASIRSNFLNAFNAVVGASPSQVALSGSGAHDSFTRAPHRHSLRDRASPPRNPQGGVPTLSRTSTGYSNTCAPAQDPFADDCQIPLPPAAPGRDARGLLCPSPPDSLTRASSMYSTVSMVPPVERVCDEPPQLPSIRSLSGDNSPYPEGQQPGDDIQVPRGPRVPQHRERKKTRRHHRPALLARHSSSQNSASSVGSDMSRTSSACSELTDGERFAKDALRERRRRVMEMSVGRAKTRRARATTLSRRRSNEKSARLGKA